jgi:hypothetical protein
VQSPLKFCKNFKTDVTEPQKLKSHTERNNSVLLLSMALQLSAEFWNFQTTSFHLLLPWTRVVQFGTFNLCISFLTSSSQRIESMAILKSVADKGVFQFYPCLDLKFSSEFVVYFYYCTCSQKC